MQLDLKVECLQDIPIIEGLAVEWSAIESSTTVPNIFARHRWNMVWLQHFVASSPNSRRPFVMAIRESGTLVGLAPWYLEHRRGPFGSIREIRPIGYPESGADHLDIIAVRGREKEVIRAIVTALWGPFADDWDRLRLYDFPSGSKTLFFLTEWLDQQGLQYSTTAGAYCPAIKLPADKDIVACLGARGRRAYRHNLKGIAAAGQAKYICYRGREALPSALRMFDRHRKQWPKTSDRFYGFLESVIRDHGDELGVRLSVLEIDGVECHYYLQYATETRRHLYMQAGDRDRHPKLNLGKALLGRCLEEAIEDGLIEFDFLKGGHAYKFDWADSARRSIDLVVERRRVSVVAEWLLARSKDLGRLLLRQGRVGTEGTTEVRSD